MIRQESAYVDDGAYRQLSALDGIAHAGRHGRRTAAAGVFASEVRHTGLALVTSYQGKQQATRDAAQRAFGVALPSTPRRVAGRDLAFIWSGPDQWLAYVWPIPAMGVTAGLTKAFAGLAAIVDQSHARTLLRLSGPRVRDAFAKGMPIDLHPTVFKTGDAAITTAGHIGTQLWQLDDAPTYELAVARSLAKSFWHWLEISAAEYGLEVRAPISVA
jgi:sarcosine oxidase subunit gamma